MRNFYLDLILKGGEQWRIGVSSILSAALGLHPFKDVFWSTSVQPNNPYGSNSIEFYPELNAVVSVLTAGPGNDICNL